MTWFLTIPERLLIGILKAGNSHDILHLINRPKVYIETTVVSYVLNDHYPDEQKVAKLIFEAIKIGALEGGDF